MSPVLAFGDDRSEGADICWSWIEGHRWEGWRLEIVTAVPHPDLSPVALEEAELHPWEPGRPRLAERSGFADVVNLRADIDPRVALISRTWDLVAVGRRGPGALKALHLGSTADWLLREPTSPLLICRRPEAVRSVLFAADGSAHARRALDTLVKLPWVAGLGIQVLSVDDGHTDVEGAQSEALTALAEAGADPRGEILKGRPGRTIPHEIERTAPDMVVMGVRGLKGIKRVVGSTTAAVAKTGDPTLLVAHAFESL